MRRVSFGIYYSLLCFLAIGLISTACANNLATIFVSLELTSLNVVLLIASLKRSKWSTEAAMKYLVLGAMATGIMFYGFSIIYGISSNWEAVLSMPTLSSFFVSGMDTILLSGEQYLLIFAVSLLVFGMSFKFGMAPFHLGADIYEGSSTSTVLLIATLTKFALVALWIKVFGELLTGFGAVWQPLFIYVALFSIAVGNILTSVRLVLEELWLIHL